MKALFLCCFVLTGLTVFSQVDTTTPPFRKYPTLPPLQVILADSTTKYTKADLPKNKPVLVMLFSPDCEHCQHEAEEIAAKAEELNGLHIVMITTYPLYRLKEFGERYGVANLPNVVLAKDPYYLLIPFYDVRNFPFMALYNKKGKLIDTVAGSLPIEKVLQKFGQKQ